MARRAPRHPRTHSAAVLAVVACSCIVFADVSGALGAQRKCTLIKTSDSVCRASGAVLRNSKRIALRRPVRLTDPTTILAMPGAVAWVGFGRQARCRLGLSREQSEIYTRPDPTSLFRQSKGRTRCNVFGVARNAHFLCDVTGACPARLTVRGEFIANERLGGPARISSIEAVRRTRIIICSGFARVRVEFDGGYAEVGGGATGSNEYVVDIVETASGIDLSGSSRFNPRSQCDR